MTARVSRMARISSANILSICTSRSGSTLRIAHEAFATTFSESFDHFSAR